MLELIARTLPISFNSGGRGELRVSGCKDGTNCSTLGYPTKGLKMAHIKKRGPRSPVTPSDLQELGQWLRMVYLLGKHRGPYDDILYKIANASR